MVRCKEWPENEWKSSQRKSPWKQNIKKRGVARDFCTLPNNRLVPRCYIHLKGAQVVPSTYEENQKNGLSFK